MIEKGLRVGLIGEAITSVTMEETALTMGSGSFEVYATPSMVALMEAAAVSALAPYLKEDYASVGIEINTKHIAATPIGEGVTAMAEITRIDGKRVHLEIRAWDEKALIGTATHVRYIVHIDEFMDRVHGNDSTRT
ncbi:MAG: thioesterase family protein [Chloroflexota bacterium]